QLLLLLSQQVHLDPLRLLFRRHLHLSCLDLSYKIPSAPRGEDGIWFVSSEQVIVENPSAIIVALIWFQSAILTKVVIGHHRLHAWTLIIWNHALQRIFIVMFMLL